MNGRHPDHRCEGLGRGASTGGQYAAASEAPVDVLVTFGRRIADPTHTGWPWIDPARRLHPVNYRTGTVPVSAVSGQDWIWAGSETAWCVPIAEALRSSSNRTCRPRLLAAPDRWATGVRRAPASSHMSDAIEQGGVWIIGQPTNVRPQGRGLPPSCALWRHHCGCARAQHPRRPSTPPAPRIRHRQRLAHPIPTSAICADPSAR